MKYILTITIFLSSSLFANYAFTGENTGKIDMHGGKSDKLIINKNAFSTKNINPLSNMGIVKPTSPLASKVLIEEEKTKKEIINKEK